MTRQICSLKQSRPPPHLKTPKLGNKSLLFYAIEIVWLVVIVTISNTTPPFYPQAFLAVDTSFFSILLRIPSQGRFKTSSQALIPTRWLPWSTGYRNSGTIALQLAVSGAGMQIRVFDSEP